MILHVIDAKYEHGYTIFLRFNDGLEGSVDLSKELYGEVFSPLLDVNEFKKFSVDPELNTIVWENGADFAPEFLQSHLVALDSLSSPQTSP